MKVEKFYSRIKTCVEFFVPSNAVYFKSIWKIFFSVKTHSLSSQINTYGMLYKNHFKSLNSDGFFVRDQINNNFTINSILSLKNKKKIFVWLIFRITVAQKMSSKTKIIFFQLKKNLLIILSRFTGSNSGIRSRDCKIKKISTWKFADTAKVVKSIKVTTNFYRVK